MITQPALYLFTLASIVTLFYILESKTSSKFSPFTPSAFFIYLLSMFLNYEGLFKESELLAYSAQKIESNLLPAMLFLLFLPLDKKALFQWKSSLKQRLSGIGCSCSIGAKKYWFLLLLSLIISFLSQFIALLITPTHGILLSSIIAILFSFFASFTQLKEINGVNELAKSMFYLTFALIGSQSSFHFEEILFFYFLAIVYSYLYRADGCKTFY